MRCGLSRFFFEFMFWQWRASGTHRIRVVCRVPHTAQLRCLWGVNRMSCLRHVCCLHYLVPWTCTIMHVRMSCLRHGEGVRLSTYLTHVLSNLCRCRVFDTYVLLAHLRTLDLHYRACADVVSSTRNWYKLDFLGLGSLMCGETYAAMFAVWYLLWCVLKARYPINPSQARQRVVWGRVVCGKPACRRYATTCLAGSSVCR